MVRKNNKWNISKEKGEELAHQYIIEILSESRNQTLTLSELIILLNQRTKYHKISQHWN
jgi:1,2-phenylacetyl-CoA epoxidase catalytic subunit